MNKTKEPSIRLYPHEARGIISGRQTQARRAVKPPRGYRWLDIDVGTMVNDGGHKKHISDLRSPYGQPGDRLWGLETWAAPHNCDHLKPSTITLIDGGLGVKDRLHYAATEERGGLLWRPSTHMPRWASRITLEVTGLRVERLQDISEADTIAEGITKPVGSQFWHADTRGRSLPGDTPQWAYRNLWESINGPGSWDANDWVRVVEFKRCD